MHHDFGQVGQGFSQIGGRNGDVVVRKVMPRRSVGNATTTLNDAI